MAQFLSSVQILNIISLILFLLNLINCFEVKHGLLCFMFITTCVVIKICFMMCFQLLKQEMTDFLFVFVSFRCLKWSSILVFVTGLLVQLLMTSVHHYSIFSSYSKRPKHSTIFNIRNVLRSCCFYVHAHPATESFCYDSLFTRMF